MTERLYDIVDAGNIGFVPSVHVLPATIEGLRVLAMTALRAGELDLLDRLELHALRVLMIEPADSRLGNAEPLALLHTERGIVIQWRAYSEGECPACEGAGELTAYGKDGIDYDVECPRCGGSGIADDGEEEEITTDIDGLPLAA